MLIVLSEQNEIHLFDLIDTCTLVIQHNISNSTEHRSKIFYRNM